MTSITIRRDNGVETKATLDGKTIIEIGSTGNGPGGVTGADFAFTQDLAAFVAVYESSNGNGVVAEASYPSPPAKKAAPAKKATPAKKAAPKKAKAQAEPVNGGGKVRYTMPANFTATVLQVGGDAKANRELFVDAYPDIPWQTMVGWIKNIAGTSSSTKFDRNADIRRFAEARNLQVASKGRISGDVQGAYEAALRDGSWPPATTETE